MKGAAAVCCDDCVVVAGAGVVVDVGVDSAVASACCCLANLDFFSAASLIALSYANTCALVGGLPPDICNSAAAAGEVTDMEEGDGDVEVGEEDGREAEGEEERAI